MTSKRRRAPRGGCWHVNGRFYAGGQFIPLWGEIVPARDLEDEGQILAILAGLPADQAYTRAMDRLLRGRASGRDHVRLRAREVQAIGVLRDRATTDAEWRKWADRYAVAVAGC